ncbi:adenylate cyclase [Bradyrhizobium sp. AZCC 1577]|uniref:response regulator n=1 Tax=Bradyrhizobium sp. AZCC 1577 TaxID=3117019 RepID=UPI002FEF7D33
MHHPPRILIVDDSEANRDILSARLAPHGYELMQAADGDEALATARESAPDLILLDVMMPKIDGIEVCRRLKQDAELPFMPIILVTARADTRDVVTGLEAGADEYLTKPIDQSALVARVKSVLRLKELHDKVQGQARELADWNRTLEQRVTEQVAEIERMGRLKSFLAPQIAEIVLSSGEELLDSHRRDVTVLFCDLRGFTAFAETAEPEEVIAVLREYHADLGGLIHEFEGTLHRFTGDGIMVVFNDPLPCVDPALRAVRLAVAMRDHVAALATDWRKLSHELGFGVGIAHGLRHARPHRLRGPVRLFGHRLGRQSRRATVRRGEKRTDPDRQQGVRGDRGACRDRACRRARAQGLSPSGPSLQCECVRLTRKRTSRLG